MSENYIVSARKYRPATFQSVVGQQALTRTLRNAIASDRLAQAYLFCGPRGVGKTSCARIFAKTINCLNRTPDGEACGECESCKDFQRGTSYNVIELDAASNNGVNEMKNLIEQVNIPPQIGKYRVFIVDEVHMLSTQAFNAFLKTLEEPPAHAIFVMATTEKNKVLPTILSRCQIFDFSRITDTDIASHLKYVADSEGISTEPLALDIIARKADGAMRDALSIFDQVAASSEGNVSYQATLQNLNVLDFEYYFKFVESFRKGDVASALLYYKEIRDKGFDSQFFLNGLASHIRNLMVALAPATLALLEVADRMQERYIEQAREFGAKWYYEALQILNDADLNYRIVTDKQLLVEITLIRLCQLSDNPNPTDNKKKIPLKPLEATQNNPVQVTSVSPTVSNRNEQPTSPPKPIIEKQNVANTPPPPIKPGKPRMRHIVEAVRLKATPPSTPPIAAPSESTAAPPLHTPNTSDTWQQAWKDYYTSRPTEKLLSQAMQTFPTPMPDGSYLLTVSHQGLAKEVEKHATDICTYIRNRLGDNNFSLKIEITETVHTARLQPRELLSHIVEDNKDIRNFIEKLGLELV